MTRPLDRTSVLPELGDIDRSAGEFWVENPFQLVKRGENLSAYERNKLFLNLRSQRFLDASFASGTDIDADSRGAIICDFDGDSAPDLLVSSVGGGNLRLFRNQFPRDNHWLRLRLLGKQSNASGIGARLSVEAGGRTIARDLFPANGYMASGPAELSIGIGKSTKADKLTIRWPNGSVQVLNDVPAGQNVLVVEDAGWRTFR